MMLGAQKTEVDWDLAWRGTIAGVVLQVTELGASASRYSR